MDMWGCRLGDPVGSGKLRVHPIYGPDTDFGFVNEVEVVGDHGGYGGLTVKVSRPTIIPQGMVFFFEAGQDRSVRRPTYIEDVLVGRPVDIPVVCIEPRQSGKWREGQKQRKGMLPPSLCAGMLPSGQFSDLWTSIKHRSAYDGQVDDNVAGLLKGRDASLVAVDEMARGAMIVLDGRPVSIMIAPSRQAWRDWWVVTNLGGVVTYDALTLADLPIPIGDQDMGEPPKFEGVCYIEWGPFRGWGFTDEGGVLCYVSLHDEEALRSFVPKGAREEDHSGRRREMMREWEEDV